MLSFSRRMSIFSGEHRSQMLYDQTLLLVTYG
jgi:hypothetical protein